MSVNLFYLSKIINENHCTVNIINSKIATTKDSNINGDDNHDSNKIQEKERLQSIIKTTNLITSNIDHKKRLDKWQKIQQELNDVNHRNLDMKINNPVEQTSKDSIFSSEPKTSIVTAMTTSADNVTISPLLSCKLCSLASDSDASVSKSSYTSPVLFNSIEDKRSHASSSWHKWNMTRQFKNLSPLSLNQYNQMISTTSKRPNNIDLEKKIQNLSFGSSFSLKEVNVKMSTLKHHPKIEINNRKLIDLSDESSFSSLSLTSSSENESSFNEDEDLHFYNHTSHLDSTNDLEDLDGHHDNSSHSPYIYFTLSPKLILKDNELIKFDKSSPTGINEKKLEIIFFIHKEIMRGKKYSFSLGEDDVFTNPSSLLNWSMLLQSLFNHLKPSSLLTAPSYWAVILCRNGKFAAAIFDNSQKIILHRSFHKYTSRKKQGGSQMARDKKGSVAHSAGSQLRRDNEVKFISETQSLLKSWSETFQKCSHIFLSTSIYLRDIFISSHSANGFFDKDTRIRNIPFTTYKPTLCEVKRCYNELVQVKCFSMPQEHV